MQMRLLSVSLTALILALSIAGPGLALDLPVQAHSPDANACEINPPVLTAWRQLRYSWYPRLPAAIDIEQILQFPLQAEIAAELSLFYQTHALAIQAYRHCLFQAYQAQAPDLTAYQELPSKDFLREVADVFPAYTQLYLSPFEWIDFVQSSLLSRSLSASEMTRFYQRLSLGKSLYRAQPLDQGGWRLWLDSYDYLIAVDWEPSLQQVSLHGFWQRK